MTDKVQKIREEVERLKESGCASPIVICDTLLAFIDSLQEEPVSEELQEVAKVYADNITDKIGYKLQLRRAVVYGAKWQKDQLLKDALECPLVEHPDGYVFFDLRMSYPKDKYKAGDKVKIVVIKEEE